MKESFELKIAECQKERKESEEAIRSQYERLMGLASQSNQQLSEMLQVRASEVCDWKKKHADACAEYEEKMQRENDKYSFLPCFIIKILNLVCLFLVIKQKKRLSSGRCCRRRRILNRKLSNCKNRPLRTDNQLTSSSVAAKMEKS